MLWVPRNCRSDIEEAWKAVEFFKTQQEKSRVEMSRRITAHRLQCCIEASTENERLQRSMLLWRNIAQLPLLTFPKAVIFAYATPMKGKVVFADVIIPRQIVTPNANRTTEELLQIEQALNDKLKRMNDQLEKQNVLFKTFFATEVRVDVRLSSSRKMLCEPRIF